MVAVKVEPLGQVPIALIKIENRARYDKGDIDLMADSLQRKGQIQPVTLGRDMKLLAGERRILGAVQLGWETIRAESRSGDDKIGEHEVELDENQVRKNFEWHEVAKLEKKIFDMKAAKDPKWSIRKQEEYRDVSRSEIGRRLLLAEALETLPELAEMENVDQAFKAYTKLGEAIGVQMLRKKVPQLVRQAPQWAHDHYIVSDALEGMARTDSETSDFAEVDPPYAIEIDRRKSRNEGEGHTEDYHEISVKDFPPFMKAVIGHTYAILKPNTFAVFWYGMQWHCEMLKWLTAAKFAVNPMPAVWYKGPAGQTAQPDIALASCYEPFFLARKGQPRMHIQGHSNVFHFPPVPSSRKIHTTEKPIELLSEIIRTMLPDGTGANVFVPFLGSGVTLRAAYKLGHTGFGFDRSPAHKERFLETVAMEFADAPGDSVMAEPGD